jgi:cell division protein ZapA
LNRNPHTVAVTILEKEYQVACPPEQQAELLLSARHLDEQMRGIRATGKVIGLERIAVMAALNISHDLLKARNGVERRHGEASAGQASATPLDAAEQAGLATLNDKLDEALHQLRQIEIN